MEDVIEIKPKRHLVRGLGWGAFIGILMILLMYFLERYLLTEENIIKDIFIIINGPIFILLKKYDWLDHSIMTKFKLYSGGFLIIMSVLLFLSWTFIGGIIGFFSKTKKSLLISLSIFIALFIGSCIYSYFTLVYEPLFKVNPKVINEEKFKGPNPTYEHSLKGNGPFRGGSIIGSYDYNIKHEDTYYSEDAIRMLAEEPLTEEESLEIENELPGVFCGMTMFYAKFTVFENDVYNYEFCLTPLPKNSDELFSTVEKAKLYKQFFEIRAYPEITMEDLGPIVPAD